MNPQDHRRQDLLDGDPDTFPAGYHQDYWQGIYKENRLTDPSFIFPLILCLIPVVYHILFLLDYDLLPLPQLFWSILVYVTPSRLLDAIETYTNPLRIRDPSLQGIPRTHAAKSEAMRVLLGLDKAGGIIGSVAQAGRRRLSTLPGINMIAQAEGRPAGLGNWDNSCYQNSVLQGLASLDSLPGYLTNPMIEEELVEGVEKPEMKMAEALKGLIATLNNPANDGKRIWTPAILKNMNSFQQQDAQEYFSKVLDEIDEEAGKAAKLIQTSQGFESDDSADAKSMSAEVSPISTFRNPLEGLIAQRVGCTKCGYSEGLSMIPFNCLTVPLGRAWEYDLPECLDEYTKLEQIEGVECGKCTLLKYQPQLSTIFERTRDVADSLVHQQCKGRLDAVNEALEDDDYEDKTLNQKCKITPKNRVTVTKSRQAVIARPPKSLVVHVNRSLFDELTGELKKNYSVVRFPKILDLGPWCLGSSGSNENLSAEEWILHPEQPMIASSSKTSRLSGPLYELRAVVTHYGRHENGHYIAYRKHAAPDLEEGEEQKEQWWRLSDDDVTKVTEEKVLSQGGVFMLFYDCIEPASPASPLSLKEPAPVIEQEPVELSHSEALVDSAEEPTQPVQQSDETSFVAQAAPMPLLISPDDLESVSEEPTQSIEEPQHLGALAVAVSIPLPSSSSDFSDSEDQSSLPTTREQSIATETEFSDYDSADETGNAQRDEAYEPVKAIVVPQYIRKRGTNEDGKGKESIRSPGRVVMV